MRERAISAAVLVPILLLVLAIGGPVIGGGGRARHGARRGRGLPAPPIGRVRHVLGAGDGPRAGRGARRGVPRASWRAAGCCSARSGSCWSRSPRSRGRIPRDGLAIWMATIFGALYVSLLSFVIRLGQAAPGPPDDAPLHVAGIRAWLDPAARPRRLVLRHGRLPGRPQLRPDAVPDPHLAVQDGRGLVGGVVGDDGRRRAPAVRARPEPAPCRGTRAVDRPGGAGRRPRRVDDQASGRRTRLRAR